MRIRPPSGILEAGMSLVALVVQFLVVRAVGLILDPISPLDIRDIPVNRSGQAFFKAGFGLPPRPDPILLEPSA